MKLYFFNAFLQQQIAKENIELLIINQSGFCSMGEITSVLLSSVHNRRFIHCTQFVESQNNSVQPLKKNVNY